jgi:hypothetical protein
MVTPLALIADRVVVQHARSMDDFIATRILDPGACSSVKRGRCGLPLEGVW